MFISGPSACFRCIGSTSCGGSDEAPEAATATSVVVAADTTSSTPAPTTTTAAEEMPDMEQAVEIAYEMTASGSSEMSAMMQRMMQMVSQSSNLPPCSDRPLTLLPVPGADVLGVVALGLLNPPTHTQQTGTCSGSRSFSSPFEYRRY